ncbi:MAG: BamA/TamA family outer membrane protein [Acidiferrobacterales bacterium]
MFPARIRALAISAWLLPAGWFPGVLWAANAVTSPAAATEPVITAIHFVGNRTTKRQILLEEMHVHVGDPADPVRIEQSRQAVMDLGLFKSVTSALEPSQGGVVLVITVAEKYYFLPIPRIGHDQNYNITWGGELRWDNIDGRNQSLRIIDDAEKSSTAPGKTTTQSIDYSYPLIIGSPYELDFSGARTRTPMLTTNNGVATGYKQISRNANLTFSRWYTRESPTAGLRAGIGLVWRRLSNNVGFGDGTGLAQGRSVGFSFVLENIHVHDLVYSRVGRDFGYSGEYGATMLGSDNNYTRHLFFYREYKTMFNKPFHTLEWQLQLGLSSSALLDAPYAYALGGGSSLRGYADGSITGNAFVLANIQYLAPLFGHNAIRGVVFTDIGNAYPRNTEVDFAGLKTSVGTGLRLKLNSFVKVDLRLDVAYALEGGGIKVYASSSELF